MKRIIDGLRYDTTTATPIGGTIRGCPSDVRHASEDLYRTPRGRYFLAGEGGPDSRWGDPVETGGWTNGAGIIPLSPEEARAWAETHLGPETVAEEFSQHIEDA